METHIADKLTDFQKFEIYWHEYYVPMLMCKHELTVVRKVDGKLPRAMSNNCINMNQTAIYRLNKLMNIMSFSDFISKDNIRVIEIDGDWEKAGWAGKVIKFYNGIYSDAYYDKIKGILQNA